VCPVRPIPQPCAPGGAPNHLADAQAYDWNSHLQPGYAANPRALYLVPPPKDAAPKGSWPLITYTYSLGPPVFTLYMSHRKLAPFQA